MGHQDRRPPPISPRWGRIADLIAQGGTPKEVLEAMRDILEEGLSAAERDAGFLVVVRHLLGVSVAGERDAWPAEVAPAPGGAPPITGFAAAIALSGAMGTEIRTLPEKTALADLAIGAAVSSMVHLTDVPEPRAKLPEPGTATATATAMRRLAGSSGFGDLAESFLASFTFAYVDALLSRELPRQTGNGLRFQILADRVAFSGGIDAHIRVCCSRVKPQAAAWYASAAPAERSTQIPAALHDAFHTILRGIN